METFSVKLSRMETQTALRRFRYYLWTKKKSNHFGKKLKSLTSVDENVEKRKCYPLLVAVQFFFFFFFICSFLKLIFIGVLLLYNVVSFYCTAK